MTFNAFASHNSDKNKITKATKRRIGEEGEPEIEKFDIIFGDRLCVCVLCTSHTYESND